MACIQCGTNGFCSNCAPSNGTYNTSCPNCGNSYGNCMCAIIGIGGAGGGGGAGGVNIKTWATNGTNSLPVNANVVRTTIDSILTTLGIQMPPFELNKCNSCDKDMVQIAMKYRIHMERNICVDCIKRKIDKFVGINIDEKTEEVLYGKKD